jgi:hypothetical protein
MDISSVVFIRSGIGVFRTTMFFFVCFSFVCGFTPLLLFLHKWLISDMYKEYENRTSSNYIIPLVNKQYDFNVADLVDAPDDGPLRPKYVLLRA